MEFETTVSDSISSKLEIERYTLKWKVKKDIGVVTVKTKEGKKVKFTFDTAIEFSAVARILQNQSAVRIVKDDFTNETTFESAWQKLSNEI